MSSSQDLIKAKIFNLLTSTVFTCTVLGITSKELPKLISLSPRLLPRLFSVNLPKQQLAFTPGLQGGANELKVCQLNLKTHYENTMNHQECMKLADKVLEEISTINFSSNILESLNSIHPLSTMHTNEIFIKLFERARQIFKTATIFPSYQRLVIIGILKKFYLFTFINLPKCKHSGLDNFEIKSNYKAQVQKLLEEMVKKLSLKNHLADIGTLNELKDLYTMIKINLGDWWGKLCQKHAKVALVLMGSKSVEVDHNEILKFIIEKFEKNREYFYMEELIEAFSSCKTPKKIDTEVLDFLLFGEGPNNRKKVKINLQDSKFENICNFMIRFLKRIDKKYLSFTANRIFQNFKEFTSNKKKYFLFFIYMLFEFSKADVNSIVQKLLTYYDSDIPEDYRFQFKILIKTSKRFSEKIIKEGCISNLIHKDMNINEVLEIESYTNSINEILFSNSTSNSNKVLLYGQENSGKTSFILKYIQSSKQKFEIVLFFKADDLRALSWEILNCAKLIGINFDELSNLRKTFINFLQQTQKLALIVFDDLLKFRFIEDLIVKNENVKYVLMDLILLLQKLF